MNDGDMIGQLFMVDFSGPAPSAGIERLIADAAVGGVILFEKNIISPGQVASLTNGLQRLAAAAGKPPILVGADGEAAARAVLAGVDLLLACGRRRHSGKPSRPCGPLLPPAAFPKGGLTRRSGVWRRRSAVGGCSIAR